MAARQRNRKPVEKHGMSKTREYRAWADMLTRCTNPKFIKHEYYSDKGVKVCERWMMSFVAFYEHMGPCPPKHSLDRIDSNKDYEPGNCRWVTQAQQMRNQGRNRLVTYNGKTQCLTDWALELGVTFSLLNHRLARGWSVDRAFSMKPFVKATERMLTHNGRTMNLRQWGRATGFGHDVIASRINRHGWSVEKALTTPVRKLVRKNRCSRSQDIPSRE